MTSAISLADSRKVQEYQKLYSQKKAEKDYTDIFFGYTQTSLGIYRIFSLFSNVFKWPLHYAKALNLSDDLVNRLFKLQGGFKFVSKNLLIPRLANDYYRLENSYKKFQSSEIEDLTRNRDKFIENAALTTADTIGLVQLGELVGFYSLRNFSPLFIIANNIFNIFQNLFSIKINKEDYFEHDEMLKIVSSQNKAVERLKILFHELKNLDMIRIAKAITSIALSVFLLSETIFQYSILPGGMILLISTAYILLAIWKDFYQKSLTYKNE
jgi:hypothetical protein